MSDVFLDSLFILRCSFCCITSYSLSRLSSENNMTVGTVGIVWIVATVVTVTWWQWW
jgi:hypothetical protein